MLKRGIKVTNPDTTNIKNIPPKIDNVIKKGHSVSIVLSKNLDTRKLFLKEGDKCYEKGEYLITEAKDNSTGFVFKARIKKSEVLMITYVDMTKDQEKKDD